MLTLNVTAFYHGHEHPSSLRSESEEWKEASVFCDDDMGSLCWSPTLYKKASPTLGKGGEA